LGFKPVGPRVMNIPDILDDYCSFSPFRTVLTFLTVLINVAQPSGYTLGRVKDINDGERQQPCATVINNDRERQQRCATLPFFGRNPMVGGPLCAELSTLSITATRETVTRASVTPASLTVSYATPCSSAYTPLSHLEQGMYGSERERTVVYPGRPG